MVTRIRTSAPARHFLREWRERKGKTQQQLADLLETSKGQISNWENGKRTMTLEVQSGLAFALGIELADLFRDPDQPSVDELLRRATPEQRRAAFAVVQALLRDGTNG